MSCWQLTVLYRPESRTGRHQTSTRLLILRGMSGEGERVNLRIAGGLGICFERNKDANRPGPERSERSERSGTCVGVWMWTGLAASSCDSCGKKRRSCKLHVQVDPRRAAAPYFASHVRSDVLKRLPGPTRALPTRKHIFLLQLSTLLLATASRSLQSQATYMKPCPADTIRLGASFP